MKPKRKFFKKLIILIIGIIVMWLIWSGIQYYFFPSNIPTKDTPKSNNIVYEQDIYPDTIQVRIYYPLENKIVFKDIGIIFESLTVKKAGTLIREYLKYLQGELGKTKILGIYKSQENLLYIDFSSDFKRGFSGNASDEYNLLKSLYQTIRENIPEIKDVKILIEGKEVDSIGGHFNTLYSLEQILEKGVQETNN